MDAVEIDPRIHEIGQDLQPDHPYQDPRVTVHIDDGRAFLERTHKHVDLILFALPDSITLVAGQSSLRLESYLFTKEAMQTVRAHLAPGGVFAMYNYYREQWLIDRYAGTLADVFGHPPCVDSIGPAVETSPCSSTLAIGATGSDVGVGACGRRRDRVPAPSPMITRSCT